MLKGVESESVIMLKERVWKKGFDSVVKCHPRILKPEECMGFRHTQWRGHTKKMEAWVSFGPGQVDSPARDLAP